MMWRDLDAGPAGEEVPWSERIAALKSVGKYPSVALFVLVIGGIYLGVFTPLHDQRLHNLHLTEKGRELLSELIPEALDWEAQFVSPLSSSEYRDLFNMMRKLERQVDRMES